MSTKKPIKISHHVQAVPTLLPAGQTVDGKAPSQPSLEGQALTSEPLTRVVARCPQCHRDYVWVPTAGPYAGGRCLVCHCALVTPEEWETLKARTQEDRTA